MGRTCGILIIGDEILKGQTKDTNSHFLSCRLFNIGVAVKRTVVVPDDVDVIAEEVFNMSRRYDIVLTSGGIGSTHDDVTYEAVAKAFGQSLTMHPTLVQYLKAYLKVDDHPAYKMANVPVGCKLHNSADCDDNLIVSVKNVYIFPGIPSFLEQRFHLLENHFRDENTHFHVREVFIDEEEHQITGILNKLVTEHSSNVTFGSYPNVGSRHYKTKITLQSENLCELMKAENALKAAVHNVVDMAVHNISMAAENIHNIIHENRSEIASSIISAATHIENCLNKYGLENMCLSFNGGKDCTALLHLVHGVLQKKFPSGHPPIQCFYIASPDSFKEMEDFVVDSVKRYNLSLLKYPGPIRHGLELLKKDYPRIKAILMGTRRSDPYSSQLSIFHPTDPEWPEFMRVSAILDWSYQTVWMFIRSLKVPYCSLYDAGYTSLDNRTNSTKNPKLLYKTHSGESQYYPAYFLKDCSDERGGRH